MNRDQARAGAATGVRAQEAELVLGGPGTGKTTAAIEAVLAQLGQAGDPASVVLLVPSRAQADRLRDEVTRRSPLTLSQPVVRTFSAFAFDVIRRAQSAGLLPLVTRAPRLLSGAEQDARIGEMLAEHRQQQEGPDWPESLREALGTRGFRREIREFLDRCAEWGLTSRNVRDAAQRLGVPEWGAAADFMREYVQVENLEHPEAYAPSALIRSALNLLREHPGLAREPRPQASAEPGAAPSSAGDPESLDLLVVDDLQEATASQHELVATAAAASQRSLLFASPDTVVQGFRGARPDLLRILPRALEESGLNVGSSTLRTSHRLAPALADAVRRAARRLPTSTPGEHRELQAPRVLPAHRGDELTEGTGMDVRLVATPAERDRLISRHVLEAHHHRGVPFEDIAVIVRSGSQVRSTARALGLDGISTRVPPVELPLRDEAAVRPLLTVLDIALKGPAALVGHDAEATTRRRAAEVEALLTGSYGRGTSLDTRELRHELLVRERLAGGERSSTELLAALVDGRMTADEIRAWDRPSWPAVRVLSLLEAAQEHSTTGNTPSTALWGVWEAAGVAQTWQRIAIEDHGLRADRANRDLDAVMALFQAAERFSDQFPGAGLARFIEHVMSQDLPMDSLARMGAVGGRVEVLTPAAAAGREWDTVIVAGLQEGQWPTTALRGTLLRSDDLARVAESGTGALTDVPLFQKLREVRQDELRQFLTAISRARTAVHLVAVQSENEAPSPFLDLVREPHTERPRVQAVPRPPTLTTLTALLRRTVETAAEPGATEDAARVLGRLASVQPAVPGADPSTWWGLAPLSSADPVVPGGQTVRVSPSKVETVLNSPLDWFVGAAGGTVPTDLARTLGMLVHSIAEENPSADEEELALVLERRWHELDQPGNWVGAQQKERVLMMMRKLATYTAAMMKQGGRELVAVEQGFSADLPGRTALDHPVKISGIIDRVERTADGRPFLVDLKTGKRLPSAKDAERHPQLGAYQAAVLAGGLRGAPEGTLGAQLDPSQVDHPGGALLVGLGDDAVKVTVRAQAALEEDEREGDAEAFRGDADAPHDPESEGSAPGVPVADWATELVLRAASLMAQDHFAATHGPGAGTHHGLGACVLPGICPVCREGRAVTEL